ncbi:23S rRNA (adenine(1618)-N(6))-methyltransferase RlmF [Paraglaciecola aestuariivivens]
MNLKHPRNLHQQRYPINELIKSYAPLRPFVVVKPDGEATINFAEPQAVKALNAALLAHYYQIKMWDIPPGYLCPPVPGRADYVHHLADLLASEHQGQIPTGKSIKGLDIGVGANMIYPIIANRSYGWRMIGTDIDPIAVNTAKQIIKRNAVLDGQINIRLQSNKSDIFTGVIQDNEQFDFCMCNPPFHQSAQDAQQGTARKHHNLKRNKIKRGAHSPNHKQDTGLNFAGKNNELWCDGGELKFIQTMIQQSAQYAKQVGWFTSLVSKKAHLAQIYLALKQQPVTQVKTIDMGQGQKISRFVAWRYER